MTAQDEVKLPRPAITSPFRERYGYYAPFRQVIPLIQTISLCCFAFLAGFIDSIVGGGGLIQLPALMIILPNQAVTDLLGTNKMASIMGTSMAAFRYSHKVPINWRLVLTMAGVAFLFSFLGARVVSIIPSTNLEPVIIVLLIGIAIYIFANKDFGALQHPDIPFSRQRWLGLIAGAGLGFYDGFFGPGAGSFLIFVFIMIFGLNFLQSSASSKFVNVATNLAALLYFVWSGHILLQYAIPMATCNVLGAITGTRLAILKGNRFIRMLFLLVVVGIIVKLSYDTFLI